MDATLTKIISDVETHIHPEDKPSFDKIVLAGKKLLYDPKFHQNMELVKNPASRQQPVQTIARGVTGLLWIMYLQSQKSLKPTPLILAGCVLMCDVIDFAERSFNIQFNPQMVSDCWKLTMQEIYQKLGVSPQDLQDAINKNSQQQGIGGLGPQGQGLAQNAAQQAGGGILGGQNAGQ
jgi:hypothetical protein